MPTRWPSSAREDGISGDSANDSDSGSDGGNGEGGNVTPTPVRKPRALSARDKVDVMRRKLSERSTARVVGMLRIIVVLAILMLCVIIVLLTLELNSCRARTCPPSVIYNASCSGILRPPLCFEMEDGPAAFTTANSTCESKHRRLPSGDEARRAPSYLEGTWLRNGSTFSVRAKVHVASVASAGAAAINSYYCVR